MCWWSGLCDTNHGRKEEEWNSFELRQYDSEIGRWLSTDPYGQHASPYMAMSNDPVSNIDPDGGKDGNWFQRAWNNIGTFTGLWGNSCGAGIGQGIGHDKFRKPEKETMSIYIDQVQTTAGNSQTAKNVTFVDGYANLGALFMQGTVTLQATVATIPNDLFTTVLDNKIDPARSQDNFVSSYFQLSGRRYLSASLPSFLLNTASNAAIDAYRTKIGDKVGNIPVPALKISVVAISHRNDKNIFVHKNWLGMVRSIRVGSKIYKGGKGELLQRVKDYTENITLKGQTHNGVEVSID
jgi:RHS repeat-associated protein